MNEPPEDLLRQLEQATSHDLSAEQLDDETAPLRESWLMLGRLLEAAEENSEALVPASKPRATSAGSWRIALAIAAALLIAWVSWSMTRRQPSANPTQEIAESAAETNEKSAAAIGKEEVDAPSDSELASEFAWDDAFEEELTKASVAIHSARSDWTNSEASYSSLSDRFAEFEQELEAGSL